MTYHNIKPAGIPETSRFVLVGEQPGRTEVRLGQPFIGPAGRVLNECLQKAGITRAECYITNVVKTLDKPLEHFLQKKRSGPVESQDFIRYLQLLKDELSKTHGIIIAIGNVALYALTGRWGITKWRGSMIQSNLLPGRIVIPVIHPATVIPPKNQFLNKLLIQFDLNRARQLAEGSLVMRDYDLIIRPSFDDSMVFLHQCLHYGLEGQTIDYDIEIYNEQVSCISFAIENRAISIPFVHENGDYFTLEQEAQIWLTIAKILEDSRIRKRGQNIVFDTHFLLRRYGIRGRNFDDTMIAQGTLMPDYPKGLDFITSIWTCQPYYKDEGKKYFSGGNWPRLWKYNATDSLVCAEAFPKQLQELKNMKNLPTYERQRRLIEPLVYMMEHGIKVDTAGMARQAAKMNAEAEELQEQLNALAGQELNAHSPKQLKEFFYITKGYTPYKKRGSGGITVDNDALKRLIRKGSEEAKLVQRIRKLKKASSTYLDLNKIDPDGRIRCSFNPVGTRYSRLSSSQSIFGTGMNLQNWPYEMLRFLLADEGYVYYSFDLAQAENRIVAYVGQVTPMIEAFESGADVHSLTAALIFQKPVSEISDEEGSCPLGDGTHSERFWGKKANHGLNYDLGYKTFAFYYEIPERDAKFIIDRYHNAYPGVRQRFHAYVRRQLAETRTLTNLMGRRTKFLGQWGDALFKEAYSCIPQGTVGDLINERGLEYVYYDQTNFGPLELLVQVHDSMGFQLPLSLPLSEHARILMAIRRSLEQPLSSHGTDFVIPVDLSIGYNFSKLDCEEIKWKNFPATEAELEIELKKKLEKLDAKKTEGLD